MKLKGDDVESRSNGYYASAPLFIKFKELAKTKINAK